MPLRPFLAAFAPPFVAVPLALALASPAAANGRYPSAQQLVVDPSDASRLWLRATYGLLTSADAGQTWTWICESAVGFGSLEDPPLWLTANGTALLATSRGLRVSTDHGCRWSHHPDIGDRFSLDLTGSSDGSRVLLLTSVVQQDTGHFDLVVWSSEDAGGQFTPLGPPITNDLAGQTLDVAPSDPDRLYVTGLVVRTPAPPDGGIPPPSDPDGVFLRSRDGGLTWERRGIPSSSNANWPLIAAVHPTNPDVVYVRVRGRPRPRDENVESWLLHSTDAGDTWTEIFRAEADMLGFALDPGGTPLYLGLGDSYDPSLQRTVDPDVLGVYRAESPGGPFERALRGHVGGLTRAPAGLYLLGNQERQGFEVGLSTDRGATAEPVLTLGRAILGPPSCGNAEASVGVCRSEWPQACGGLSACSPPDGGPPDAGDRDAGRQPMALSPEASGCGCRSAATTAPAPGAAALAALAALLALSARRRRPHSWT